MNSALAQWDAKMAVLEAEELELRARIKMITEQKDAGSGEREVVDGEVENDVGRVKRVRREDDSNHEDKCEGAVSEVERDEVEQTTLSPSPKINPQNGKPYRYLPAELILQIVSYVAKGACSQQALATCCLLSRPWYNAALPHLYRDPKLYGKNFEPFARAICPSINLHVRKSPLAELVRVLDMSQLVHQGSKSVTARLLGRTKNKLEEFIAPQASFSIHSFPALGKCAKLRVLDLSLVSESPPLPDLFKSISALTTLRTLRLPRSTGFGVHHKKSSFTNSWPPNITHLTLSGGIDAHFLHGIASFPQTLTHLTIEHCPLAKTHAIKHLLKTAVRPLEKLEYVKIAHMPRLSTHALDEILFILPQITHLSISVDYITMAVFDEGHFHHDRNYDKSDSICPTVSHQNLRMLELTNSGGLSPLEAKMKVDPLYLCTVVGPSCNGDTTLPKLRQVRVAQSLGWHLDRSAIETEDLTETLQYLAREDWKKREGVFAEMSEEKYGRERVWETVSGVWIFEG